MKKISIMILFLVVALASCKKTPEVNLKYVDVERDLVTVGRTIANIQCDYAYIATLKKAYLYYGENEDNYATAEMRVVQNTLYVELSDLKENTTYCYYYEFHNGFNSIRTALKSFKTETGNGGGEEPPTPEIMLPTVITAAITEITSNSAKGGGEVTNDGGAEVTERGICWSTNANPTLNDSHIAAGTGIGAFNAAMSGLEANTTYHVRAYAINEKGTAYGLDREFVTLSNGGGGGNGNAPVGAIDGLFTINENGDQVYFSQGNLQYQASTNTWRFAEHQWDFVGGTDEYGNIYGNVSGSDNSSISPTYNGWIDLFGWGTSGYDHGSVCFQPWSTSENISDYYAYGIIYYNLYDNTEQADWGYNAIANGGNQENSGWRTLTYNEWDYLLRGRHTLSEIHFAKAIVSGLNGIILLPDNWNSSYYTLHEINNDITGEFSDNIITVEDWTNIFEVNGAVFLPAAGLRSGTSLSLLTLAGSYWLSSVEYNNYNNNIETWTWCMIFENENMSPLEQYRYPGLSVRLIHDAISQPSIHTPTVFTFLRSNVTSYSAECGGDVANDGGSVVTESGICWSVNENPTLNDNHVAVSFGTGAYFTTISDLEANTTYHIRAYANNSAGTAYGMDTEFTTLSGGGSGEHEYVDLGLPSGLLWATCNVGADAPEDYGDYFAWGETQPKEYYSWSTYQFYEGGNLTKYTVNDGLTILLPEDDAATVNWGSSWRMPTKEEWQELCNNTTVTWTTQNGVNGKLFTAANGNSLFLPAAGDRSGNSYGYYWSSSRYAGNTSDASSFDFDSEYNYLEGSALRYAGRPVRPIQEN